MSYLNTETTPRHLWQTPNCRVIDLETGANLCKTLKIIEADDEAGYIVRLAKDGDPVLAGEEALASHGMHRFKVRRRGRFQVQLAEAQ